jgi:acylphosphatase
MTTIARHALVSGAVQGVGFRHYTKVRARELGLGGWVRNLPDGRVEAWLEGSDDAVQSMLEWLRRGPTSARVDDVAIEAEEPAHHAQFRVVLD